MSPKRIVIKDSYGDDVPRKYVFGERIFQYSPKMLFNNSFYSMNSFVDDRFFWHAHEYEMDAVEGIKRQDQRP